MPRHHRNIEEEFQAIAPPGYSGIPSAQPIAVGETGSGGADSEASASQASQEISQLEEQFKQQSELIQANTQALQDSTAAHSGSGQSVGGEIGSVAGGILGGGLGLLSPIVSGIMSLFGLGGSSSAAAPLPFYTAPPSVQISDTLRTGAAGDAAVSGGASIMGTAAVAGAAPTAITEGGATGTGVAASVGSAAAQDGSRSGAGQTAPQMAPQITVNVSAMDSQSFMDRSGDIANAVREAMLNLHPINDVVANL